MPVSNEIETNEALIVCWDITETVKELEAMCRAKSLPIAPEMHLESRRKQVMVTSLLHHLLFPGTTLNYAATGKPYVDSPRFVSITHSGDTLTMMRSDHECGVDIERVHPRVRKVRHKFLSDAELLVTETATDEVLTQYWTAKEAMFKVNGSDRVFMRSNIFVHNLSDKTARVVLNNEGHETRMKIRFQMHNDKLIAWTETCDEK